ncbi:MAG: DedA family protein [Candidatus Binatia bacterium]
MNFLQFLAYTSLGTVLWSVFLAYLGYILESNFTKVGAYLDPVSWIVSGAIGVFYIVRVIKHKGAQG